MPMLQRLNNTKIEKSLIMMISKATRFTISAAATTFCWGYLMSYKATACKEAYDALYTCGRQFCRSCFDPFDVSSWGRSILESCQWTYEKHCPVELSAKDVCFDLHGMIEVSFVATTISAIATLLGIGAMAGERCCR